jgi:molybdenum cofactor cytidylyltransferase
MGKPKLLLDWKGRPHVEHILEQWRGSRVALVVVVIHPDDHALAEHCRRAGAEVVAPDNPPPDMKSSVGHALDWIRANASPRAVDAWMVAPADMPRLSAALIDRVITTYRPDLPQIILPASGGRTGHPVLFPWPHAAEVSQLGSDEGLNALVARSAVKEISWEDPTAFVDIDHPEDYEKLIEEETD